MKIECSRKPAFENKIKIGNAEVETDSSFKYSVATVNPINVIEE